MAFDEEKMKELGLAKFETRILKHPNGELERKVFINGEMLDWSVDLTSFREAQKMGPMFQRAIKEDIAKHFTESISDLLGRKVSMEDVARATKTGFI
jgi:hypothetical protein